MSAREERVEALADEVYRRLDPGGYGWAAGDGPTSEEIIEALLDSDALRALLAEERASAWDEGFTRGFYDPLAGHGATGRDASESAAVNPYEGGAR